ncbi:MAG: hypothetical protein ACJ741_20955 [Pyrinomonadaceae bacterium]
MRGLLIVSVVQFLLYNFLIGGYAPRLWFALIVAVMAFFFMRSFQFCDACGRTLREDLSGRLKKCPECGADLKD